MLKEGLLLVHGNTRGVAVAAGVTGLTLQSVGLPSDSGSGESSSSVRTGRSGAVDTPCPAAHGVHLELGHVLQLGDSCQLQVERVHYHPGHDVDNVENQPDEEHDDVVGEDHVIDDEGIDPGDDSPRSEDSHRDQPRLEPGLLLQSESIQSGAGTDEHGDGTDEGEEGAHEEEVPHVVVADVHEVEREEVIARVTGARLGLLQDVHLEDALEAAPDGEEECVEGAVPGASGQVGVEGVGHEGLLVPLEFLVLEAGVSPGVVSPESPGGPHGGGAGVHGPHGARVRHLV